MLKGDLTVGDSSRIPLLRDIGPEVSFRTQLRFVNLNAVLQRQVLKIMPRAGIA